MGRETEAIEDNIKRIQDRMSERVDHLTDDLSLSSIASRTLGANGEKPGELVDAAINSVREHPIPAALIGIGLVGLLVSQKARPAQTAANVPVPYDPSVAGTSANANSSAADRVAAHVADLSSEAGRIKAAAGHKIDSVQNAARDAAGNARTYADEKADELKQAYSNARSGIGAQSDRLKEQTREIGDTLAGQAEALKRHVEEVPQQVRKSTSNAADWARENPVPVGLMALALGAAAASLFTAKKATGSADDSESSRPENSQSARRPADAPHVSASTASVPVKSSAKPKPGRKSAASGQKSTARKSAAKASTAATRKKSATAKNSANGTSAATKSSPATTGISRGGVPRPAGASQDAASQKSDAATGLNTKS